MEMCHSCSDYENINNVNHIGREREISFTNRMESNTELYILEEVKKGKAQHS